MQLQAVLNFPYTRPPPPAEDHSTVLLNKERKIFGTVLYYISLHKQNIDAAGWKIGFAVKEHMDQE